MKNQKTLTERRAASRLLKLMMLSDVQYGDTEGTRSSGICPLISTCGKEKEVYT